MTQAKWKPEQEMVIGFSGDENGTTAEFAGGRKLWFPLLKPMMLGTAAKLTALTGTLMSKVEIEHAIND